MNDDFELKGIENRKKRAVKVWKHFKTLYDAGMSVTDIAKSVKKKNGKPYSRSYIYEAFEKLKKVEKEAIHNV